MTRRIAQAWVLLVWAGIIFVTARIIIPALVNSQNDGALIAAPVVAFAVGTAAIVTITKVFKGNEE